MAKHLIDSDVIIWALRGRSETIALLSYLSAEETLACSAVNLLEVELGAKPSEMKAVLSHMDCYDILPVDAAVASKAAELMRTSSRKPYRGEWADAVIAATAIIHNLTIVTYNIRHYSYHDLPLYPVRSPR